VGNLLNISYELPVKAMLDHHQAYCQWICLGSAFQSLPTKANKEVFQYPKPNGNAAKERRNDDMPLTKTPIQQMINTQ
jgi:hypothetical protein